MNENTTRNGLLRPEKRPRNDDAELCNNVVLSTNDFFAVMQFFREMIKPTMPTNQGGIQSAWYRKNTNFHPRKIHIFEKFERFQVGFYFDKLFCDSANQDRK